MSGFLRIFQVFEKLFEARYRRRYDTRLQLMAYQIRMLQARIDADRIHTRPEERAELTRLGATTISDILKCEGHHPIPEKGSGRPPSNWKLFVRSHMDTLAATDFFTKPVLTWHGWVDAYVLVFIHLGSRRVFMSPATFNPDEKWVLQQSRNVAMWFQDLDIRVEYLIHNRDTKYSKRFRAFWKSEQMKCIRTPIRTPVANSYVECYIGKAKRECLNHLFCVSLERLDYINREWIAYYNEQRPHQGTDTGNKVLRPDFRPTAEGDIKREQRLGGVISYYYRTAA